MDIQNKVVVITGASEGIGKALAEQLHAQGATVVLAARSADKLAELTDQLAGSLAVPTDMRKPEDLRKLIEKTMQHYGRLDILINNAAQGLYGPLEKIGLEKLKSVFELNVFAVVRSMQLVIPIMRQQGGGMILNVSSHVSKNYFPSLSAYAATKYALNCLSLTARKELEQDHIVVGVFFPRMTATNFGRNAVGTSPRDNDTRHTGQAAPGIDTADQVAEKIIQQIQSEVPEAVME